MYIMPFSKQNGNYIVTLPGGNRIEFPTSSRVEILRLPGNILQSRIPAESESESELPVTNGEAIINVEPEPASESESESEPILNRNSIKNCTNRKLPSGTGPAFKGSIKRKAVTFAEEPEKTKNKVAENDQKQSSQNKAILSASTRDSIIIGTPIEAKLKPINRQRPILIKPNGTLKALRSKKLETVVASKTAQNNPFIRVKSKVVQNDKQHNRFLDTEIAAKVKSKLIQNDELNTVKGKRNVLRTELLSSSIKPMSTLFGPFKIQQNSAPSVLLEENPAFVFSAPKLNEPFVIPRKTKAPSPSVEKEPSPANEYEGMPYLPVASPVRYRDDSQTPSPPIISLEGYTDSSMRIHVDNYSNPVSIDNLLVSPNDSQHFERNADKIDKSGSPLVEDNSSDSAKSSSPPSRELPLVDESRADNIGMMTPTDDFDVLDLFADEESDFEF